MALLRDAGIICCRLAADKLECRLNEHRYSRHPKSSEDSLALIVGTRNEILRLRAIQKEEFT